MSQALDDREELRGGKNTVWKAITSSNTAPENSKAQESAGLILG